MSSSESARLVLVAVWLVAVLVLTSAVLRLLSQPPKTLRSVVAWIVSTFVLGGLLFVMDRMLGAIDWPRQLLNLSIAAAVSAAGLVAGSLLARWPVWSRLGRFRRLVLLVSVQAAVVFVVGYPFL